MSLSWNDISLSLNETSLGGMNTSLDVNDISRRRKRYIIELKRYVSFGSTIIRLELNDRSAIYNGYKSSSPAIRRRCTIPTEILFKYCRYIGIIAITTIIVCAIP